jgi:hypothetical protein
MVHGSGCPTAGRSFFVLDKIPKLCCVALTRLHRGSRRDHRLGGAGGAVLRRLGMVPRRLGRTIGVKPAPRPLRAGRSAGAKAARRGSHPGAARTPPQSGADRADKIRVGRRGDGPPLPTCPCPPDAPASQPSTRRDALRKKGCPPRGGSRQHPSSRRGAAILPAGRNPATTIPRAPARENESACPMPERNPHLHVMAGLDPATHVLPRQRGAKAWILGSGPKMTAGGDRPPIPHFMAGRDPATHVCPRPRGAQGVDPRVKPEDDGEVIGPHPFIPGPRSGARNPSTPTVEMKSGECAVANVRNCCGGGFRALARFPRNDAGGGDQ